MSRRIFFSFVLGAGLFLSACTPTPEPVGKAAPAQNREYLFGPKGAPSSSYLLTVVAADAGAWVQRDPGRRNYCLVEPTASMLPYFDSGSVLLLESATGFDLRVGDFALYASPGRAATIGHKVVETNPKTGYVIFAGANNSRSDGWVAPDRVLWRVAGVLFSAEKAPR